MHGMQKYICICISHKLQVSVYTALRSFSTRSILNSAIKQEKYYNVPTYNVSRADVVDQMSKLAVVAVGKNMHSAFLAGFNDSRTDSAARISFKVRMQLVLAPYIQLASDAWKYFSAQFLSTDFACIIKCNYFTVWLLKGCVRYTFLLRQWYPAARSGTQLQEVEKHYRSTLCEAMNMIT